MDNMDRRGTIQVDNETQSSSTRVTTDGRTLTYEMRVLQQPLRARACGQGAKCEPLLILTASKLLPF